MNIFKEMTRCLSFPSYRIFRASSGGKNFLYMLVLTVIGFLLSVVIGLYTPLALSGGVSGFMEKVPDFEMSQDGILTVDRQYQMDAVEKDTRVFINTDYDCSYDDEADCAVITNAGVSEIVERNDEYSQFIIIARNGVVLADDDGETNSFEYIDLPAELLAMINKTAMSNFISKLVVAFLIAAFVFKFFGIVFYNIINAIIASCICSSKGVKSSFGQNYSMGLRAYTLPYIVGAILSMAKIPVPFKSVALWLVTGIILANAIKVLKKQLDEDKAAAQLNLGDESNLAFRALNGNENPFEYNSDDNDNQ